MWIVVNDLASTASPITVLFRAGFMAQNMVPEGRIELPATAL